MYFFLRMCNIFVILIRSVYKYVLIFIFVAKQLETDNPIEIYNILNGMCKLYEVRYYIFKTRVRLE